MAGYDGKYSRQGESRELRSVETRRFEVRVARRRQLKLKIGVTGPSGSGKTLSSLLLAYGLAGDWGKVAFADTENESAEYYAGEPFDVLTPNGSERITVGDFLHIPFRPPYDPRNFIDLIRQVENEHPDVDVLVIDCASHEWNGEGGCLQLQEQLGGRYQDWSKVTPLHTAFIEAIKQSRLHIICTLRVKQDYDKEQGANGKLRVTKLGMKVEQREGIDYEMGLIFDVDMHHFATASKNRTPFFKGTMPFQISHHTGKQLAAWARLGLETDRPITFDRYDVRQWGIDPNIVYLKEPEHKQMLKAIAAGMGVEIRNEPGIVGWLKLLEMHVENLRMERIPEIVESLFRYLPKTGSSHASIQTEIDKLERRERA